MQRKVAENILRKKFGFTSFHDRQWEAIDRILQKKRVLLIEKTGFGKSLCYQFPATQFDGVTIVFSPLISLMRDQVRGLEKLGIPAKLINSNQTDKENAQTLEDAKAGKLKILYIAPERIEDEKWTDAVREIDFSMIVIDEAHCISVWGHDFRPAYRRILDFVNLQPRDISILATTATATQRVQKDVQEQLGNLHALRGDLIRENFHLFAIKVAREGEKYLWLAENLPNINGTGIIYAGKKADTENIAAWLRFLGIEAIYYHAGLTAEERKAIEQGLMENRWKVIVSTNALGMGLDKPDIRFVIHTQIPASPIHYYQEIGRAGRDGELAYVILFYQPQDCSFPQWCIDNSDISPENYDKVITALKREPLSEKGIMSAVNLKKTPVKVIIVNLLNQKIIIEPRRNFYEYRPGAPALDTKPLEDLRQQKQKELNDMIAYVNLERPAPRMKFLCDYLGDSETVEYKNCDNTTYKKRVVNPKKETREKLREFENNNFIDLKFVPEGSLVDGVASSYYGASEVGQILNKCKYKDGGYFPDKLLDRTVRAFRKKFGQERFDVLVYPPSTKSGDLVKNVAERLAKKLGIPISHQLEKTRTTKPQKSLNNGDLKRANVAGAFAYSKPDEIRGKSVLLFDDIFDNGATIQEIGRVMTKCGSKKIAPLVIAKTMVGDV